MSKLLALWSLAVLALAALTPSAAAADDPLDGIWFGTYTSTHSPSPTREVLLFGPGSEGILVGVYLSASGSAGIADGRGGYGIYSFIVSQPASGCPEPARGVLQVVLGDTGLTYEFHSRSCQGIDVGQGRATRSGDWPAAGPGVQGFWKGTYTSTHSPSPTHETLVFAAFGARTVGVYLSDSGATGILTGAVRGPAFVLDVDDPQPGCPGGGSFSGALDGDSLSYTFEAEDCRGSDLGQGKAERFVP